jgi:preprotein translocase subunit SecE
VAKTVRNNKGKSRPAKGADKSGDKAARASEGKSSKSSKTTRGRAQARAQARSSARSGREKRSLRKFVREVRVELGKVSWPDRRDLMQSTLVVLVAVLIATVYVAGLDAAFSEVVDQILNLIT